MKARYLGIIFIAAVIVPSILLAVLSIRSAGREEAFVEKQLATTLLAEVTHAASLVNAETAGITQELRSSITVPEGSAYRRLLPAWKKNNQLVGVPFLLSPRYGILWPEAAGSLSESDRLFLEQNAGFLSDRSATPVFQNITVVHQEQILAEARKLDKQSIPPAAEDSKKEAGEQSAYAVPPASAEEPASSVPEGSAAPLDSMAQETQSELGTGAASGLARQRAQDVFTQSADVQAKVYEQAREKGERLNVRVAQPMTKSLQEPRSAGGKDRAVEPAPVLAAKPSAQPAAPGKTPPGEPPAAARAAPAPSQPQPSQFVTTSRLLSQIASQGEFGIIPRFIGDKLDFLFWSRQRDGRIAGCQIALEPFRERIAGVLPSTYSPARILAILDEKGAPLAPPPGSGARDWRRPFVSQEIGESLPRWEAAAYLTDPSSISAQARSASVVIWILVLILFMSVAGGGTMVLTSVYSQVRLAQKKAGFVTNVSHELKTPLTSISLFVDLLRRTRKPDPEKRERYLAMMAAETERLGRLINNVLDFSSMERGGKKYAKKTIDLALIAREVVEGQRARLESHGFTVSFGARGKGMLAEADGEAIKQVLLNLLSNAEKYSPRKKDIEVEVVREGATVAAHVRDRGIGVAEKDRERIFREFFRVDDSLSARVPGTGLGLTIARRIARDHGGDVTCRAREGGGSDFAFGLPAAGEGSGNVVKRERK